MRLDKLLSDMGAGTRNALKKDIRNGLVKVNGETVYQAGMIVDEKTAVITYGDQPIHYRQHFYFMMNKPAGTLCISGSPLSVLNLIAEPYKDLFCVGRLDKDTEGLLLITNDGQLAHALLAPRRHVDKVYEVTLRDPVTEEAIKKLEAGIRLNDEEVCAPAKVDVLAPNRVHLTIHEGKYHQVKRMFAMCDNEVVYLKRIQIKNLVLDPNLEAGGYRALSEEEEADLKTVLEGKKEG